MYCTNLHENCLINEIKELERQKEVMIQEKLQLSRIPVNLRDKKSENSIYGYNNQIYRLDDRLYLLNRELDAIIASREIKKKCFCLLLKKL